MTARQTTRTRNKPRRDDEPTRRILLRALGFGLLATVAIWLSTTLFSGVPARDYGKLFVSAVNTGNLTIHDPVRIGGARVGQVMATELGDDGRAQIELQLQPGLDVPEDSEVRIRANGLLGARFVELRPGTAEENFANGATLRANDNALTFGLPEALDTFDQRTRGALGTTVGELGRGLIGRGQDVNRALEDVGREVDDANAFLDTLLEDPAANRALLPSANAGFGVVDANRKALTAMFDPAADAVTPLEVERAPTQEALDLAPSTLGTARDGLTKALPLLDALDVLTVNAERALRDAPRGLTEAAKFLAAARAPVARAEPLLSDLKPTVPAVLDITDAAKPVLAPLSRGLRAARPTVEVVGRYGCDVQNFATTWRSMTGYGGPGEGPAGPAMAFRLQVTPPGPAELFGLPDATSMKDPYAAPCKYAPSVYDNFVTFPGVNR